MPMDAERREQHETELAGSLAARSLELAETRTCTNPTYSTDRLTRELSGSINREAIDLSA